MGLTLNRLYKTKPGNNGQKVGFIVIGGTGTTLYGSSETPSAFANMVDLNAGSIAAGSFVVIDALPGYILFDGDATSIQIVNASTEDTGTDINA